MSIIKEHERKYFMKKDRLIVYILFFLFLLSTRLLTYQEINLYIYKCLLYLSVFFLFVFVFSKNSCAVQMMKIYPSYRYVYIFIFLPAFTCVSCLFAHSQAILYSIQSFIPHYLILTYFVLIYYKIKPVYIVKIILIFSILRTGLTLIEQFTYPYNPFAFRADYFDEYGNFRELEQRSGFYRFLIGDAYFLPLFSCFFSFVQLIKKIDYRYLLIFLFSALGIYMDGSRQVMIAFVVPLVLFPVLIRSKRKFKFIVLFAILAIVVYLFYEELFGELILKTNEEDGTFNGRLLSYSYFWNNTGAWYTKLFGNGIGYGSKTEWGRYLMLLHENSIRPHDVGVVGAVFMLGWGLVVCFFMYYWHVIRKNWKDIDIAVRLYLISILIMIPFIFPLYNGTLPDYEMFLSFIFYLVDASIIESKKKRSCGIIKYH